MAGTSLSKDDDNEMGQHTETRVEEQPSKHVGGGEEGFEEVTYRWTRRKQQQQVIIGPYRDSEIKAEKKKAWIYLSRNTKETMIEGVRQKIPEQERNKTGG